MRHYPTMTIKEIKNLNVESIAAPNCVLFLWVTFPKLQQGLDVIKAWGFKYKTLGFSWHKTNQDGSLFFGVGSYAKSNAEICLMATRGNVGIKRGRNRMWVRSNKVSSAINSKREGHSKKPEEIKKRITQLFGDKPRIELFARKRTKGWDTWGNQL